MQITKLVGGFGTLGTQLTPVSKKHKYILQEI